MKGFDLHCVSMFERGFKLKVLGAKKIVRFKARLLLKQMSLGEKQPQYPDIWFDFDARCVCTSDGKTFPFIFVAYTFTYDGIEMYCPNKLSAVQTMNDNYSECSGEIKKVLTFFG
jgi:hypothetical protein